MVGEASGDQLGAGLMKALLAKKPDMRFFGIGGNKMQRQGLDVVFPMSDIAVMGFGDVLGRLPHLFRKLDEIVASIIDAKPDLVICIDAPDFNHRLAKRLKKAGLKARIINYVVPSVWFWRASRARSMADYFDHCLCLLPFEPAVMKKLGGPPCTFVGHNAVQSIASKQATEEFKKKHKLTDTTLALTLLPGSRQGEIVRLFPMFMGVAERLKKDFPQLHVFLPIVPHMRELVEAGVAGHDITLITDDNEKHALFGASDLALAASGTVALELGLARVPMVIAYPSSGIMHKIILKFIARAPSVNLVNIALDEPIVPEMLSGNVSTDNLYRLSYNYLADPKLASRTRQKLDVFSDLMRGDGSAPDKKAAQAIIELGGF